MKLFKLALIVVLSLPFMAKGQEISLTHSGTQYDAFENPAQSGFEKNLSKRNALGILPAFNILFNFKGPSSMAIKELLFTQDISNTAFNDIGSTKINRTNFSTNLYLFTYRIIKSEKNDAELGISFQLKEDARAKITNETFALIDTYNNFTQPVYQDVLNGKGTNQSYWQLNVNYRRKYNEQWAYGGKVGLIDGITYNKLHVKSSDLSINTLTNSYSANFVGNYYSNFGDDTLSTKLILPDLKNLGLTVSGGISYTSKKGYYFTAHLKDLGFIHWHKSSVKFSFNNTITVANANSNTADDRFITDFSNIANNNPVTYGYYSSLNTKLEVAVSKRFKNYMPVFVISKSTFRSDGQIGVLNNFKWNILNLGINPIYDFNSGLNLGTQVLLKSPNIEFYIGSEALKPTQNMIKGFKNSDETIGDKTPRASFYIGFNFKFEKKESKFWLCK
jgi:hypothetical protein